jgi:uncharacterized membrane protein YraQ (UPF0718 family)
MFAELFRIGEEGGGTLSSTLANRRRGVNKESPMTAVHVLGHALGLSFGMFWQILWALVLGFGISGAVEAVVSKEEMSRLMPDDRPRSLIKVAALGAASSSCSYAAVALARSIFLKGADFTAAMAFEIASTTWSSSSESCWWC